MNALRMEKGFKGAGELTNEVTLPEADVMRFVKLDKDFFGKAQTEQSLAKPLPWVCAYLEIEPDGVWDGNGGEAVRLDGKVVGSTASVAYGHTAEGPRLRLSQAHAAEPGTALEVFMNEQWRAAKVLAEPAYDPQSLKPRTDVMEAAAE
jgi:dimethylglycine dehydrogenase